MREQILKVKQIVIKEDLYPREKVNESVVKGYAKAMKNGDKFPSVYVALFKGKHYLVDGRHRLEAYDILGDEFVQCEVKNNFPSFDDIFLASVRANLKHGSRLSKQDRWKIALKMSDMKYKFEGISKITGIDIGQLERSITGKVKHIFIKDKIKSGEIPRVISEKVQQKENVKVAVVDKKAVELLQKNNKLEFQIYELQQILKFFKEEELELEDKKIINVISNIKKVLKKKYPKL